MADAKTAFERRPGGDLALEVCDLARGFDHAPPLAFIEDSDPGGVVAAVFEAFESLHEDGSRLPLPDIADDPAHLRQAWIGARKAASGGSRLSLTTANRPISGPDGTPGQGDGDGLTVTTGLGLTTKCTRKVSVPTIATP